jgi:hypothetical protein
MPCRVNRTFRLPEKLKISQQPNRRSAAQLGRLIPVRSFTRSADVISPDTTVPPGCLAFCLPTRPSTKAWAHISKIHRVLRVEHPASYPCMPSPHYSLLWPPLLDFTFGQGTILDFGTRRDATTRARPDDGGTPSISPFDPAHVAVGTVSESPRRNVGVKVLRVSNAQNP